MVLPFSRGIKREMGISKDQAYKILGLEEGAPDFLVRSHYCRLAHKYHPDKNPHNRDVALHKFQKIVDAYVRLQIEPDDCDQMKMKMILTELYAINEDILTDEYGSRFPDELDIGIPCTDIVPASSPPFSSSAFSERGPYAEVLQDFMIRNYMSGGRRTKPSVNMTVDKKLEASDRAMEIASKHADELLKDEEEERMKEEKRKQKNKRKKEAKKKKKGQTNSKKKQSSSSSRGFVIDDSIDDDDDDDDDDAEDEDGVPEDIHSFLSEELDITGSFFSKVNVAINDQPIGSIGAETFSRGDSISSTTSKSSISSKGSIASSVSENTCPSPRRSISNSSTEYSLTGNCGTATISKKASVDTRKASVDCMNSASDAEVHLTKVTAGTLKKAVETPKENIEKPLREINDDSLANGKGKSNNTGYHKERQMGKTHKGTYWSGDKGTFKPNPSNYGKHYQSDLPPRFAKLAQSKGGRQNYSSNDGRRAGETKYTYSSETTGSYDGNTCTETEEMGTTEGMMLSMDSTRSFKETDIVKNPAGTGCTEQYSCEAVSRNGAGNELDESRRMAVLGSKAAKEGQFHDAAVYFSKAIQHYAFDIRYYGNRSFCYEHLKDYKLALQDANEALRINEDWPKGHFRKGKALVGLQKYEEAEECFKMAVKHDPGYTDAVEQLQATQIKRLMEMGFSEEQSVTALSEYEDVDKAVESLLLSDVDGSSDHTENERPQASLPGSDTPSESESPKQTRAVKQSIGNRLWVGNVNPAIITEGMLFDAFKRCVSVEGVHIIEDKYCAFVEFSSPEDTAIALEQMQDYCLEDCSLYLRIPDNPNYSQYLKNPKKSAAKFNKTVEECRFWRTTGCFFGAKCRYIHIPKNKGIDNKFKRNVHPSQTYWRK